MNTHNRVVAAGFLSALLSVVACTKNKKLEYGLIAKETARLNLKTEPPTLDWNKASDVVSSEVLYNTMDGLVQYNLDDPEHGLLPDLATEWSASKDAKIWTFTLRKGVLWTDGVELVPQHFVDGLERLLNPKTASEYAYALYPVKNARSYNQGKLKDFSHVGIKLDGDKLIFELEAPKSFFPYLVTHSSTYPVRKDLIEKHGDHWTDADKLQTLGPYALKLWDHDKALVLTRNDRYFGAKAKIKNLLFYMINETSTSLNLFDSGRLDALEHLPSREISVLKKRKEYRQAGSLDILYIGFNVRKKPLDDPRIRKALVMAVDRKQVTEMMANGSAPLYSWVPPGMFGYEADIGIKFDPARARELLEEAGYADRGKLPKIEIGFNSDEDHQRVMENVQAQLKKNLNINVELKNEEWKTYLSTLNVSPPLLFRFGWRADYPDPDNFLVLMQSFSENNKTGWKNLEFDKLVDKGASFIEKDKRRELYRQAQRLLIEQDAAVLPILSEVGTYLVSDRLIHFPINALHLFRFDGMEIKE